MSELGLHSIVISAVGDMLKQSFEEQSYRLISVIACVGFLGFFYYANAVKLDFAERYQIMNLLELLPFG